jgi:hypothetical protein
MTRLNQNDARHRWVNIKTRSVLIAGANRGIRARRSKRRFSTGPGVCLPEAADRSCIPILASRR